MVGWWLVELLVFVGLDCSVRSDGITATDFPMKQLLMHDVCYVCVCDGSVWDTQVWNQNARTSLTARRRVLQMSALHTSFPR